MDDTAIDNATMSLDQFIAVWHRTPAVKGYRKGQALFNLMSAIRPDVANTLAMTPVDCFHQDENIEAFLDKARDNW